MRAVTQAGHIATRHRARLSFPRRVSSGLLRFASFPAANVNASHEAPRHVGGLQPVSCKRQHGGISAIYFGVLTLAVLRRDFGLGVNDGPWAKFTPHPSARRQGHRALIAPRGSSLDFALAAMFRVASFLSCHTDEEFSGFSSFARGPKMLATRLGLAKKGSSSADSSSCSVALALSESSLATVVPLRTCSL